MMSSNGTKNDVGPLRLLSRRVTRAPTMVDPTTDDHTAIDIELASSSFASLTPILYFANDIEKDNPRVAYLCETHSLCWGLNYYF